MKCPKLVKRTRNLTIKRPKEMCFCEPPMWLQRPGDLLYWNFPA